MRCDGSPKKLAPRRWLAPWITQRDDYAKLSPLLKRRTWNLASPCTARLSSDGRAMEGTMTRGGKRPGAGRKREGEEARKSFTWRFPPSKVQAWTEAAARAGMTLTAMIEVQMDEACGKDVEVTR